MGNYLHSPCCDLGFHIASTGIQISRAARQASLEEYVKFASVWTAVDEIMNTAMQHGPRFSHQREVSHGVGFAITAVVPWAFVAILSSYVYGNAAGFRRSSGIAFA